MGVTRFGAYATEVIVDYRYLYPIPSSWTFEGAASFLCQALTAWYGLVELGGLRPSSSEVIYHFPSSWVGFMNRERQTAFTRQYHIGIMVLARERTMCLCVHTLAGYGGCWAGAWVCGGLCHSNVSIEGSSKECINSQCCGWGRSVCVTDCQFL